MYEGVEDLLSQMTLREKVSLLAGTNMWYTVPVKRLGIPSLKMTDGPNGARGAGSLNSSVKDACFPAEISLASTWNTDLVERVGQALAHEAKTKGAQVHLEPGECKTVTLSLGRDALAYYDDLAHDRPKNASL